VRSYVDNLHMLEEGLILTVCSKCTGVPVPTHRILLPGLATRCLVVCSQCSGAPVHTRRILLPGIATRSLTECSQCTGVLLHSLHPHPWPGHSLPNSLIMVYRCLRMSLYTLAASSSSAVHGISRPARLQSGFVPRMQRVYGYTGTL